MALYVTIIGLILGFFLLVKGAEEMVRTAIQIAMKFNMPNSVIGATFIGLEHRLQNYLQAQGRH